MYIWESHILLQWEVSVRPSTLEIFPKKGKLYIRVMESGLPLWGWEHFLDQRSSNAYSKALSLVTNEQVQTTDGFSLFFAGYQFETVWKWVWGFFRWADEILEERFDLLITGNYHQIPGLNASYLYRCSSSGLLTHFRTEMISKALPHRLQEWTAFAFKEHWIAGGEKHVCPLDCNCFNLLASVFPRLLRREDIWRMKWPKEDSWYSMYIWQEASLHLDFIFCNLILKLV